MFRGVTTAGRRFAFQFLINSLSCTATALFAASFHAVAAPPSATPPAATPAPEKKPAADAANRFQQLQDSKAILRKWMQTQEIISKELADWQTAKEVMNQRADLTRAELDSINEKLKAAENEIAKAEGAKKEHIQKQQELLAAAESLRVALPNFEDEIRMLQRWLPLPFQEKIAPIFQRIPPDTKTSKISMAERYQNVIGILNEISKLNSELTVVSEIRLLETGKPTEAQTIYLGLGAAYYLSMNGDAAGIGKPGDNGWEWTPRNEITKSLGEAMAVMQNKMAPKFVVLPATVE
jgi:Protein of unknown function (DUF3450)